MSKHQGIVGQLKGRKPTGGLRPAPLTEIRGPRNPLASRFEEARGRGGGIQPAVRPAPEGELPFEKLTRAASRVGRGVLRTIERLNRTGSRRSPTTRGDR